MDVIGLDYTGNLNVVMGKGNGTFQTPIVTNLAMSNTFYDAIAVGDFNGDHVLDVAVWAVNAATGNTEVHIFPGNGTGALRSAPPMQRPKQHFKLNE